MAASLLDTAIQIAAEAHAGQKQKNGQPYILHPLRVMMRMRGANHRLEQLFDEVVAAKRGLFTQEVTASEVD